MREQVRVSDAGRTIAELPVVPQRRSREADVGICRERGQRVSRAGPRDWSVRSVRRSARPGILFDELELYLLSASNFSAVVKCGSMSTGTSFSLSSNFCTGGRT